MDLNLKDAIKSAVLTKPGDKWPTYDGGNLTRWKYLTASEASRCIRLLAFDKAAEQAAKPIDDYWDQFDDYQFKDMLDKMQPGSSPLGVFARGHNVEAWLVEQIRAVEQDHELFLFMGGEQVSFYHRKHKISGTPDGIYVNRLSGDMRLLEFKSSNRPITQPQWPHRVQVQVNMGLITVLRQQPDFEQIIGHQLPEKFSGANLLYVNPADYIDMQEFDVEYDGGLLYHKMAAKSAALFNGKELRRPEELEPQGLSNNGCFFCKHKDKCAAIENHKKDTANAKKLREIIDRASGGGSTPKMPVFKADMSKEEVVKLLVQYNDYDADEKRAKKQKDALKEAIKLWIKEQHNMAAEFEDDGKHIKVSLSSSNRAGGLIKEKVEKLIADVQESLDDYTKPGTLVETLRVSVTQVQ